MTTYMAEVLSTTLKTKDAEIAKLKAELDEAREIMRDVNDNLFEHGHRLPCMAKLRAFLNRGER